MTLLERVSGAVDGVRVRGPVNNNTSYPNPFYSDMYGEI